jgi:hypothetical protein
MSSHCHLAAVSLAVLFGWSVAALGGRRSDLQRGCGGNGREPRPSGRLGMAMAILLHGPQQSVGLHLGLNLRDIVPEDNNIVRFAVGIPDMVAQ